MEDGWEQRGAAGGGLYTLGQGPKKKQISKGGLRLEKKHLGSKLMSSCSRHYCSTKLGFPDTQPATLLSPGSLQQGSDGHPRPTGDADHGHPDDLHLAAPRARQPGDSAGGSQRAALRRDPRVSWPYELLDFCWLDVGGWL